MTIRSENGLLTPGEVAHILRLSRWSVYKKIAARELGSVRLGRGPKARHRIPSSELARYIVENFGAPGAQLESARGRTASAAKRRRELEQVVGAR